VAPLLLKILDHVFFLRPLLLAPAATMFLIGRAAARRAVPDAPPLADAAVLATAAAVAAALVATHVANQIADRASDRANRKLPYLAGGLVTPSAARVLLAAALLLFALLLPLVPWRLAPLALLGLALGLAYAAPPLHLKARAGWDLAANAVGYGGLAFAFGWGSAAPLAPAAVAAAAAPWVLAVGAVFASTTVVDAPGDAAAGQRTLAVRLGAPRARGLALLLLVAAVLAAAAARAPAPLLLAAAAIPTALRALLRPSPAADHHAFQVGALLPTLYAAARAPLYGVALLAAFAAARAYHAARFGLRYPALGAPARTEDGRALESLGWGGAQRAGARRTIFDSSRLSSR
jgi:4-hydroxybenzoate polyprenyltransferase